MKDYILTRLRTDADHLLARAENEAELKHQGIKGRFRELLIDTLLLPWLPPYVSCGTGMIIAAENSMRQFTQDDVIVFDRSLIPPILASASHAPDGVFLCNSVLARVEVKSQLTRGDIRNFVAASRDISELKYTLQQGSAEVVTPITASGGGLAAGRLVGKPQRIKRPDGGESFEGPFNLLFAYGSDAAGAGDQDYQLKRVLEVTREQGVDPLSGIVSMVCIPPFGFWKLGLSGEDRCWQRLIPNTPSDRVAWFVGCLSNSCFQTHAKRQGRDPSKGLEGGIGMYLPHPFDTVPGPY